jgi:hypothetical protein
LSEFRKSSLVTGRGLIETTGQQFDFSLYNLAWVALHQKEMWKQRIYKPTRHLRMMRQIERRELNEKIALIVSAVL